MLLDREKGFRLEGVVTVVDVGAHGVFDFRVSESVSEPTMADLEDGRREGQEIKPIMAAADFAGELGVDP
jgi:hypothetical protein